jgi:chaperonin GroES
MPDEAESIKQTKDGLDVHYVGDEIEIDLGGESAEPEKTTLEFDDNLADELSDSEQVTLGLKLKEYVEVDLRTRAVWERRMLDGLEIIGLEDVPDDAVAFQGAAQVNYPGIAEAMVQFQARAMDELMPPEGPVKCGVLGKSNDELEAQAERVQDYMNYQLMEEDDEYYSETDDLLLYLPYAGSAFRKVAPDPVTGRTRSRFVPASDFIVPYWAKSLKTAPRYTHRYTMPINVFRRAVDSGYFLEVDFEAQTTPMAQQTMNQKLADTSDEKEEAFHEDDRDLTFCEMTIDMDFEWETHGKDLPYDLPYVITFEWETGRVVRIARCWEEHDVKCQKDVWYVHYKFLPGLGFYGWGYLHLIGGLGRAASGALRLLLDGSATASLQGGFKSRDARIAGDVTFTPATWTDVDMTAEELAKSFYSPPFKEPSPALFKTLEILINGVQRFASTTEAMVGDAKNTGPVGTTVALIEQGSKIFSGIHKRIHAAARREFKMIALSNFRYMADDEYPFKTGGSERRVLRDDFSGAVDIIPVSDPNIFSSVQRIAIAQAGVQMVDSRPDLYPRQAQVRAHRAMWKALRVPDADKYLPEKMVKRLDPVSENVAIMTGIGVQVFIEQDDAAHLQVHAQIENEIMALPPEVQQRALPALQAHIAAHLANAYRKRVSMAMEQATGVPLPNFDPNNYDDNEELPPEIETAVARAAAQFAPPPPAPAPPPEQADVEAAKDEAIRRDADRKDFAAQREEERKDMKQVAELKRDGLISDVEEPPANLGV